jgi:hypothetical protein
MSPAMTVMITMVATIWNATAAQPNQPQSLSTLRAKLSLHAAHECWSAAAMALQSLSCCQAAPLCGTFEAGCCCGGLSCHQGWKTAAQKMIGKDTTVVSSVHDGARGSLCTKAVRAMITALVLRCPGTLMEPLSSNSIQGQKW